MDTVWAPPEEGAQGIINISALTWMCLVCCRLRPSECTKLLTSSTASGGRFRGPGRGQAGCAVRSAPWNGASFFSHYISFSHRMGARVCVCPFLCGVGRAHQVFPGGTRRKLSVLHTLCNCLSKPAPTAVPGSRSPPSAKEMCPVQSSCTGVLAHSSETLLKLCLPQKPRYVGPSVLSPMLTHT